MRVRACVCVNSLCVFILVINKSGRVPPVVSVWRVVRASPLLCVDTRLIGNRCSRLTQDCLLIANYFFIDSGADTAPHVSPYPTFHLSNWEVAIVNPCVPTCARR